MMPPKAPKKQQLLEIHADKRIDNYFWLNQRDTPEVLSYLEAENEYFAYKTKHTELISTTGIGTFLVFKRGRNTLFISDVLISPMHRKKYSLR